MNFHRTASGLSNLYLFQGVEVVVFVEGGRTCTLAEVLQGTFTAGCSDVKFWHELFEYFRPGLKVHFRAVGSKSTLNSIATLVSTGTVHRVVVCMDRDFDDCCGTLINSPNVMYTFGYSWENDVWSREIVVDVFEFYSNNPNSTSLAKQEIADRFEEFSRFVRSSVRIDAVLAVNSFPLLKREHFQAIISSPNAGAPQMHYDRRRSLIRQARLKRGTNKLSKVASRSIDVGRDCFGHLLADFAYGLLGHCLRKYSGVAPLQRIVADASAINHFRMRLPHRNSQLQHYTNHFNAVAV